tara:strand:+ start:1222 stop:1752 length:531 start_codon:yes stop_codon:yes gene_type:complete
MFLRIIAVFLVLVWAVLANQDSIVAPITWTDLLPEDVFDFVPETGVTEEMWEDPEFIKKVEQAGLAIVPELEGRNIRITGFMVPLEVDFGEAETVNEFVLVPSAGMCMHVPPPPPNQLMLIKLSQPEKIRSMYQPIGVNGTITIIPPLEEAFGSMYIIENPDLIDDVTWKDLDLGR